VQPSLIPLVARAALHADHIALIDAAGSSTYAGLLARSAQAADRLLGDESDLGGARVAFLCAPGIGYAVAQWAIWRAGGIAVPLCTTHPAPELDYVIEDSGASILICDPEFEPLLAPIAERRGLGLVRSADLERGEERVLPDVDSRRGAMLLYTSGTTGKPKGVLSTHAIVTAQVESIVTAWEWSESDRVLHVLPLHHLHGILNLLCCALYSGASCEFMPRFDARRVWDRIARGDGLTLFMAVPAIYAKLAQAFAEAPEEERARMSAGCAALRLMVSGSAALPTSLLDRWRALSGHTLLERYGMTEFGMGLGNPLHGERGAGSVGTPFPGVKVRLHDEQGREVEDGDPGEIQVSGPGVFAEYWRRPDATRDAFTSDGWFKTGDVAVHERGAYRILGRQSLDILKTGGFKVSALEIEEVVREHPAIRECAIVGVPDEMWGQRVAAAIVLHPSAQLELEALRAWGKERLAPYKLPSLLRIVRDLPRNAMGKVQKSEITRWFELRHNPHE
jgi:malonyl-CoA/methylmalonyl-CoA synthetase